MGREQGLPVVTTSGPVGGGIGGGLAYGRRFLFVDSCVVGSCIWKVSSSICGGFPTHRGVEIPRWRGELVYFEIEMSPGYGQT